MPLPPASGRLYIVQKSVFLCGSFPPSPSPLADTTLRYPISISLVIIPGKAENGLCHVVFNPFKRPIGICEKLTQEEITKGMARNYVNGVVLAGELPTHVQVEAVRPYKTTSIEPRNCRFVTPTTRRLGDVVHLNDKGT